MEKEGKGSEVREGKERVSLCTKCCINELSLVPE
jgi:hypothetical protein